MTLALKDKRVVTMPSTWHTRETKSLQEDYKRGGSLSEDCYCDNYTSEMGGVDRAGHYCSRYGFLRKSLKWWIKLYLSILEVFLVNSFHLYTSQQSANLPTLSHLKFLKEVIGRKCLEQNVQERKTKFSRRRRTSE